MNLFGFKEQNMWYHDKPSTLQTFTAASQPTLTTLLPLSIQATPFTPSL